MFTYYIYMYYDFGINGKIIILKVEYIIYYIIYNLIININMYLYYY